jgi:hypothetical protein
MRWRKRIRLERDGVSFAADVNAAITISQDRSGVTQEIRSVSHQRVVQDSRPKAQGSGGYSPSEPQEEPDDG